MIKINVESRQTAIILAQTYCMFKKPHLMLKLDLPLGLGKLQLIKLKERPTRALDIIISLARPV